MGGKLQRTKCGYEAANEATRSHAPKEAKVSEGGKHNGMHIGPDEYAKAALDKEVDMVTDNIDIIDFVFLIIYTWEMTMKIIAMGFIRKPHSYLRAPENMLDFVVVILGWVSSFYSGQDVSAVRTIRILRPLKATTAIPGMKSLIQTIFVSLPAMFDIMVLFMFMITVFGTVATQLLMGRLKSRCMMKDGDKWLHLIPTQDGPIEVICNN